MGADTLFTNDDFIDCVSFTVKKSKINGKHYCMSRDGVTFDFTPPLSLDRLLTPIWTESKEFSGIYWWMTGLQNCIDAMLLKYLI